MSCSRLKMMIYHKTSYNCVYENVFWKTVDDSYDGKRWEICEKVPGVSQKMMIYHKISMSEVYVF